MEFSKYLDSISPHEDTNYSLWETTKRAFEKNSNNEKSPIKLIPAIKNPNAIWARETEACRPFVQNIIFMRKQQTYRMKAAKQTRIMLLQLMVAILYHTNHKFF